MKIDVETEGFARFERDARNTSALLGAEVPVMLQRAVEGTVLSAARANTPLGPGDRGRHMRDRYRAGRDRRGVYVRNLDPGARTMEYGGRHPVFGRSVRTRATARGVVRQRLGRADWTWVYQPPRLMLTRAIRSQTDNLVRRMDDDLGGLFRRHGWGR